MAEELMTILTRLYKPKKLGSKKGTKIEMEHTPDRKLARVIAGHHESEDKNYYKKSRNKK
jgi:hypothetical protein